MKVLDKKEKEIYDDVMKQVEFKKLDEKTWKKKAPEDFKGW